MAKEPNENYPTDASLVRILTSRVYMAGTIFEPCAGDGWIVDGLRRQHRMVVTRDLVRDGFDATQIAHWQREVQTHEVEWVVTNPPFSRAHAILPHALAFARIGVAFLLRLSFLEPTVEREDIVCSHPPNRQIVTPRHSFTYHKTGKRKTDSVTTAWYVWQHDMPAGVGRIEVARRAELDR